MGLFTKPRPALFPAPFAQPHVVDYDSLIDEYIASALQEAARPRRGDKVTVAITAYVDKVMPDGALALATHRRPFHDPTEHMLIVAGDTGIVVERAPAEPRVGDTITGQQVRVTPWRAGTILADPIDSYVLNPAGQWVNTDTGYEFDFAEFDDDERVRVVYAPGKKTSP